MIQAPKDSKEGHGEHEQDTIDAMLTKIDIESTEFWWVDIKVVNAASNPRSDQTRIVKTNRTPGQASLTHKDARTLTLKG
jgi:hypothetical protein